MKNLPTPMISAQNISKFFGRTAALTDISFEIANGEIVGFLGPNGAGKTTLMRLMTSYLQPSRGKISVANFDVSQNSLSARRKIGYLPETPPLYPEMTVRDYLKFAAQLKDVSAKNISFQVEKAMSQCQLGSVQNQTILTLSKGFCQRVGIAQAIVHDPEVLILDEPTNGLDPQQILQVRNLIKGLEEKRTVLLSTHILPEIEQIARRVIILNRGQIVADQKIDELLKSLSPGGQKQTLENVFLKLTADETDA